ncbi:hypothetical protein [uncultured Anoxybacillus sp.]|uniref:hypothetical protein n=1 Tax=uncultured Anoxybacillus sp. TaxID=263860 RepID=UPI00260E3F51|nr:hypothetical protein [uncultured Anoxybacillus sp.]
MTRLQTLETNTLHTLLRDTLKRLDQDCGNLVYVRNQAKIVITIVNELEKRGEM